MGIGIRYYLFPEDGDPLKLSQRLVLGLSRGGDALPEFAGTRQKILNVVLDTDDGAPTSIARYDASVWAFDEHGTITKSLRESFAEIMDFAFPAPNSGNVVALNPEIKKRRHAERHRWKPTEEDIARVMADIWRSPGTKALKSAKGVSKRPPPLTYEARHALDESSRHFFAIEHSLWQLSEPALRGLAHEARNRAQEGDHSELYRAVAELAENKLRLIARRKSPKGVWYALVEVYQVEQEGSLRTIATYHRKCEGREAAEAAGRELLVSHAKKVAGDRSIQVSIETDLEWEAAGRSSINEADEAEAD